MEESICIQFLFDEGLLHRRMRCKECYTDLSPDYKNKTYPLFSCKRYFHLPILHSSIWTIWFGPPNFSSVHMILFHRQHAHFPTITRPVTTQVTTNNIESRRFLRHKLSQEGISQKQMYSHIAEYLWFLDCESRGAGTFHELIQNIKTVYHVQ